MKYELQNQAVIYLHLRNQEFAFVNKIAYKLKNYGLKLKFGDPTINDVKMNHAQGLFTFVVISPNLIEDITNELFL